VCIASAISECLMVIGALWLLPRGILDRANLLTLAAGLASGLLMAVPALVLPNSLVAAPVALIVYIVGLRITGAIGKKEVLALRALLASRGLRASRQKLARSVPVMPSKK
jgi:hypothetical protein